MTYQEVLETQEKEWHPDAGFAPNVTALPAGA